jgi:hypothetical protein
VLDDGGSQTAAHCVNPGGQAAARPDDEQIGFTCAASLDEMV